jgi:hypothetical protein
MSLKSLVETALLGARRRRREQHGDEQRKRPTGTASHLGLLGNLAIIRFEAPERA